MKYSWTTLLVKDLDKSIHFYENIVGLTIDRRFQAGPVVEIAFLSHEKGDTEVELMTTADPSKIAHSQSISMGLCQ
ncbi:MAG: VOC family protein [Clostridia bacterium]|nr:VOC family protein [Clostridia bacterium]